jgi:hypothetical protein
MPSLAHTTKNQIFPEKLKPGDILTESVDEQRFEFKGVSRSVVNSPESFEGIGYFSFIIFRDFQVPD